MTTDIKEDVGSENGFSQEEKEILEEKKLELKSSLSLKQDKTVIETKSSTEILTELFSAFNAEPPVIEEVCGDGDKPIKSTKKNTVNRRSSESGEEDSAGDKVKEKKGEKKKKEKKKKHKHKSSKHRHSSKKESESSGINRLHRSREKDKDDIATYSKIKEKILKASASKSKSSCEQLSTSSKEDYSKQLHDKCELVGISTDIPQNNAPSESITETAHTSYSKHNQSRNCVHESSRQTDVTGTETLEGKDSLDISGSLLSVTSDDVSAIEVGVIPLPEDCASQEINSSSLVRQNDHSKLNLKEEIYDGGEDMQNQTEDPSPKSDRIVKKDGRSNQSKDSESNSCDKVESANTLVHEKIESSSAQLIVKQSETSASSDVSVIEKFDNTTGERLEQPVNEKTESSKNVKSSISISDSKAKSKIKIKNLKFSTVFQQTLKEAEEQARKKEEEEQVKHNSECENVLMPPECSVSKTTANETQNGDANDRDYINDHSIANEFKALELISLPCMHDVKEPKDDKDKGVNEIESTEEEVSWSTKFENGDTLRSKKEQETSEDDDEEPRKDKAEKIDEAKGRKGSESRPAGKSKAKEKKKRRRSRSKSREKSKKRKRSKTPGKGKSRSRSSSVSKSKKRKRSRSRSESKGKRKKRSRSRSKGGKSSGGKSSKKGRGKHRKKSRSKSKEKKKSRSRSESVCKDVKKSRSVSKERKSVSKERKSESKKRKIASKDRKSESKERKSESKERKSDSKERKIVTKDRKSESKERKSRSKERKSRSKSKGRNRSCSKDYIRSESRDEKRSESREREKSRSMSKETKRSCSKEKRRSVSKERKNKSKERKGSRSRKQSKRRSRSCSRKSRSQSRRKSRSRSRKRSVSRKKSRSESRKRSRSRKKSRSRSRKKSRSVSKRSRSHSKKRSSSRGRKSSDSRSRRKSRSGSRKDSSSRNRRRSRSRSYRKSRSQSRRSSSRGRRKSRSMSRSDSRRSRSRKRSQSLTKCQRSRSDRESRERSKGSSSRKRSISRRKSRSRSKKRSRSHSKIRSKSEERRSSSRSRKRSRGSTHDKEKDSRRSKTVEKSKLAAAGGSESTGPSSITSGDGGKIGEGEEEKLDKARLLEIARKNAVNLLQQGSLPPSVVGKDQKGKLLTLKAGGKSVEELTEYCKELSRKEAMGESSDSDGEGGSGCGSHVAPVIHHPFQIKERPTPGMIGIGIRSSMPPANAIMDKPSDQSKLRMQFPVSSGQEHRKTESDSPLAICYHEEPEIVEEAESVSGDVPEEKEKIIIDSKDQVFPDYSNCEQNMDIGSIVSQRLTALRKLQENPDDLDALNEMTQAQKDMQVWAESKSQPGLFTGSTGAKVLSAAELASGSQAWARKDQLKCATPLTGGMGMLLLQKMGWRPGEGLGKNKEGVLEPLKLDVKTDKRGLVSQEELHRHTNVHRRGHVARSHPRHSFDGGASEARAIKSAAMGSYRGKHPVSVLVEICSKRRWKVPHFQLVFESGPDHKKSFLFKAIVNGVEYQPPAPSPNKKQAKAHAASICLQAIGVYPPTMNYEGACI